MGREQGRPTENGCLMQVDSPQQPRSEACCAQCATNTGAVRTQQSSEVVRGLLRVRTAWTPPERAPAP